MPNEKGLEPKGQVRAIKSDFLLSDCEVWKICASRRAWILHLSSWKSTSVLLFVVKTVGGMKGRDFGQKTMEQNRHGYCQSQNLCDPLPTFPPSRCLSTRLSDSFSPCSVGVMSGAHRALPMIYTVTRWRWRIAALLPDVSRKTNGDGGSYRIGFGRGGVWRGREMAYREDGCDWRLYVRSGCCSWCKKV